MSCPFKVWCVGAGSGAQAGLWPVPTAPFAKLPGSWFQRIARTEGVCDAVLARRSRTLPPELRQEPLECAFRYQGTPDRSQAVLERSGAVLAKQGSNYLTLTLFKKVNDLALCQ